ncbi:hypothetical protein M422DRAFT_59984 [Sphaerobolus stellatus SS14]|uniref:Peptidase M1 leukotriene A4 hydrolase/aminopeptidase C-terminal domain-containing protein n=1 Tax=Sphaerobolus stellatus (strain SS14) TaxID=990650 RepID=A0A0C9VRZ6_SPHS4|nr:hypothetical protein M422DRAFT_59984 [Sphaerobolus stellatus SS14]
MAIKKDPTTQSNYLDIATKHIDLKWNVDFKSQTIAGTATLELVAKKDGVQEVILDTNHLDIKSVQVEGLKNDYSLGEQHPVMGSSLSIPLPKSVSTGDSVKVSVEYSTTNESIALQWLDAAQTAGKKHPYLFSQCQPIHARSLVPLQDGPSIKQTYSASVTSVYPALLSAIRQTPPSTGPAHDGKEIGVDTVTYTYEQPIPIPSYLIAIAAGNVVYRPFPVSGRSWTSGVWCEPEIIDAAYYEFAEDTVRFLSTAEDTIAPYRFGVYDLVVLPPSFPYGGMENACLTFLTPTLLTGDRTLTDVVVHELTHSYFGNGVTQADASSFFLNEGWTTYVERLLQGVLHGAPERDFSFIIGRKTLKDSLESYKDTPKYQRLVIDFDYGEDPDDAYSSIPYEKGANLILHIERTLGGLNVFLPFIKEYVNTFTGKSISGDEWKAFLYDYYQRNNPEKVKALDTIDWQAWFYGEGTELPVTLEYDTTLANQAYNLAAEWDASRKHDISTLKFSPKDLIDFNGNQIVVFLERLQSTTPLPATHIHRLGEVYSFNNSTNCEIRFRWYGLALASPAAKDYAKAAAEWIVDAKSGLKGRMKYCRPTFKGVFKTDPELAKSTFLAHETEFHPIARQLIKKDLGLAA